MSTFTLALFPLPEVFLFPGTFLPLHIFETRYRMMLDFAIENGGELAMAPFPKSFRGGGIPPFPEMVGYGHIIQKESLPDGRSNILLEGLGTAKVLELESTSPFLIARAERKEHPRATNLTTNVKGKLDELLVLAKRVLFSVGADEELILKINQASNHPYPADFLASLFYFDYPIKQKLLETVELEEKIPILHELLWNLTLGE